MITRVSIVLGTRRVMRLVISIHLLVAGGEILVQASLTLGTLIVQV